VKVDSGTNDNFLPNHCEKETSYTLPEIITVTNILMNVFQHLFAPKQASVNHVIYWIVMRRMWTEKCFLSKTVDSK
jgi:hypothetical protein